MSNFSAERPPDSGYPNAVTLPVWNRFYRKRIFAGSLSMRMGWRAEDRDRAARFMLRVILQLGRPPLHVIPTRTGKFGTRRVVILAIQLIGIFIAISVSICPWNIWDRSRAEPENSPA